MHIEKSAVQEEYLPGRMNANPYRSDAVGMGPLMRDVKRKICIDTEMQSFLDDDNGVFSYGRENSIYLICSARLGNRRPSGIARPACRRRLPPTMGAQVQGPVSD